MTARVDDAPLKLAPLIALNLVPVIGVYAWGWQSFDIIFLYWFENLVIGAFTLARMVIRPYQHPIELVFPLFFAPFFLLHYGMFCWGHGGFVISLFGPEGMDGFDLWPAVTEVLSTNHLLLAALTFPVIQALEWRRSINRHGLGADGVKDLMTRPYRRIVVLHIAIIGSGFALAALNEPLAGLLALIAAKTASDVWHWRKDNAEPEKPKIDVSPAKLQEMADKYPRPVVTVNGEEREFESFAAMRASKEFRMAQALMRVIGAGEELQAMCAYMDMRIEQERRGDRDALAS